MTATAPTQHDVNLAIPQTQAMILHRLADAHVKALQAKVKEGKPNDKLFLEIADGIKLRTSIMLAVQAANPEKSVKEPAGAPDDNGSVDPLA